MSFQTSPPQAALWLAEPDGPTAKLQAVLECLGPLDADRLRTALARCVARHEILRTTFAHEPGIRVPFQVVQAGAEPSWLIESWIDLDPDAHEQRLVELRARELSEPLDPERGPLFRAVLVSRATDRHTLVLTLSGLVADAASAAVLAHELIAGYAELGGLPEDPLQYADFAAWQHERVLADDPERHNAGEFWGSLAEVSIPALPFTHAAVSRPFTPAEIAVDVDVELTARLRGQASRYDAGVSVIVQAAWYVLVGRLAGLREVTVSYLAGERRHADLEGAIGAFSSPIPLRSRIEDCTFAEVLQDVARARAQALVWQDYAPSDASARAGVAFVDALDFHRQAGELSLTLERVTVAAPWLRLWATCTDAEPALRLTLGFDPAWIQRDAVERMARGFQSLMRGVAADAGTPVAELPLLDDAERRRVVHEFNRAAPPPAAPSVVHELVAGRAAANPAAIAVLDEDQAIPYGVLEARANQLAHRLRRSGVGDGDAVGLCSYRCADMVVGLLGILKAGAAYVPLHHDHPPGRLAYQLSTAGAQVLVTQEALLARVPELAGETICLDRDREALAREDDAAPDLQIDPDALAYTIFTSGSTGRPKGVAVTHANLSNYVIDICGRLGADREPLSFGMVTSLATDLGNTSLFGALASGGTLILVSPSDAIDPAAFSGRLARTPVDVLKITPSHVGALLAAGDPGVLPRRWLVLGGERLSWDLVARIQSLTSSCRMLNHYGPTETTVGCTTFVVGDGAAPHGPTTVPIGAPIAGLAVYVLDEGRRPLPIGVAGRLFIAGAGVARGYVGDPALTDERFGRDPFASEDGSGERRMYDTGDLARWLPDGTLEFLGRIDEQIKIRGYRVEPAEIESALASHPEVREAVVVTQRDPTGETRLVAYCVTGDGVTIEQLRQHLGEWVPDFMLPSAIVLLESLPLTPSGKLDRSALPAPGEAPHAVQDFVAPRTPMERAVAEIWASVLGRERIGVNDDFFALGGHSLLATQVVARVRSELALELPLHSLFTYSTIASLTAEIVRMMGDSEEDETVRLLAELEELSDEDAERLLAGDESASP